MPLYTKDPQVIKADFKAGDGEVTIYVWPMNLYEMDKLQKVQESDAGYGETVTEGLMLRARNEDRQKIFKPGDETKERIMRDYDTDEVVRVVTLFNSPPTQGEVEN